MPLQSDLSNFSLSVLITIQCLSRSLYFAHLPDIQSRVKSPSDVHYDISAQCSMTSREHIDLHFAYSDAQCEIKEHLTLIQAPLISYIRGFVEAKCNGK